jgi:hypothetical protein
VFCCTPSSELPLTHLPRARCTGLHTHALSSPPSSSRAAAAAAGACDNPWGAVLMGTLCSPGLAAPPTIPRSHSEKDCTGAGGGGGEEKSPCMDERVPWGEVMVDLRV